MTRKLHVTLALSTLLFFAMALVIESSAWARAGGGRSMGSRGSKSYSSPQSPSGPTQSAPGMSTPGRNPGFAGSTQPSGGFFSRSPFLQGLAGGLAGGMIGSLLFGGMGHAATGGAGGGGIGFLEIALLGLLLYFAYRFFKKRREQSFANASAYSGVSPGLESYTGSPPYQGPQASGYPQDPDAGPGDVDRGIQQIRSMDPAFDEEKFKETVQDLFFRIQAGWTNRSLDGIGGILTDEMAEYFRNEFNTMNQKGVINRLENIAVRKVELAEVWQEAGKDYVTVLFTANLLDYTIDATTREMVEGDRMNPVKFQEFWTFCRDVGTSRWQLSAINQVQS
ncbi:MAG: Tim44 domain-containing protein [Syntrophobacteraceae bacterium]|jgi:predicted lipid-binding transport protein (Tim44 family)|nr:Tim44 domain-containing protein [Syntrophobacteraceae bacterium]